MYNVSVKNKLLVHLIIGILIIPFGLLLIKSDNRLGGLVFAGMIVVLFYNWANLLINLNNADISINEANDIITIRTIFDERKIPVNELIIKNHLPKSARWAFMFYTNSKKIIVNYTKQNYYIAVEILKLTKYEYTNQFIKDVERASCFFDLG